MRCGPSSAAFLLASLAVLAAVHGRPEAAGPERRYVGVDRSIVIDMPQFTKVSVANPAIADVVVITPRRILVNGKAAGVTTLVVFHPGGMEQFDLVVHPVPAASVKAALIPSEARVITIQRADKITDHVFVPSDGRGWVELEGTKAGPEPVRK